MVNHCAVQIVGSCKENDTPWYFTVRILSKCNYFKTRKLLSAKTARALNLMFWRRPGRRVYDEGYASTRTTSLCKRCICQLMDLHSWFWQFSITSGINLLYIGRSYQTELRAALLRRDPSTAILDVDSLNLTVMTRIEWNETKLQVVGLNWKSRAYDQIELRVFRVITELVYLY